MASAVVAPCAIWSRNSGGILGSAADLAAFLETEGGKTFLGQIADQTSGSQRHNVLFSVRTGIVLSKKGGALKKLLPLFKLGLGGKFGHGRQWWSWVSMTDQVGAIAHLLTAPVSGPVNITGPAPTTNSEFTTTLGTPVVLQKTVSDFLRNGGYDHHLRSIRRAYHHQLHLPYHQRLLS